MKQIVVIAHNLRSTHNVGSLLRTAEGMGVKKVYLTGYTPYPLSAEDQRLPHLAIKIDKQIDKTSLGASDTQPWEYQNDITIVIDQLVNSGYAIYALEQTSNSISLAKFKIPEKIAIVLGREVEGVEHEVIALCDGSLEIPMYGKKESYNVVQAAAMAMYQFRFH